MRKLKISYAPENKWIEGLNAETVTDLNIQYLRFQRSRLQYNLYANSLHLSFLNSLKSFFYREWDGGRGESNLHMQDKFVIFPINCIWIGGTLLKQTLFKINSRKQIVCFAILLHRLKSKRGWIVITETLGRADGFML